VGTLLGAYRVEGLLGSGSMGEVFRCVDVGLNRRVAIKILSEKHRDSSELRARFIREGRAVAAVSHPNVVQVFATGTYDDRPYIAMEFLDGTDLGSLVERQGPLDSRTALRVAFDAASGLEAASKAGLIHRDVKPSNLVRLTDGTVKVTDFGLAKPVDPGTEPALTAMGVVVGTPDYIAPEQARGETIDERVDIYALGGSLFFMLVGVPPFRTGKPGEDKYLKVVARHLRQPAPLASERNPAVDPELSALVQQMMAKRCDDRPSYPELLSVLADCAARLDPSGEILGGVAGRSLSVSMSRASGARPPGLSQPPGMRSQAPGAAPMVAASPMSLPPPAQVIPAVPSLPPGAPVLVAPPGAVTHQAPGLASPMAGVAGWAPPPGEGPVTYGDDEAGLSHLPPPTFPRWAIAVTLASLGLFVAGLVVFLGREPTAAPTSTVDARSSPPPAVDAPPPPPSPLAPAGMIEARDKSGKLLFYVDAEPVTAEAFRSVFANHQQKSNRKQVVSVSYTEARSYARTSQARLLTADEWTLVSTQKDFLVTDGLSEWVESGGARRLARNHRETLQRKDQEYEDITFRLVRDPLRTQ
jgi:serine/threonine protein kinase